MSITTTFAPMETQIAIFNKLSGDSTLLTLLGTTPSGAQKIFDYVPENNPFPYITMSVKPWTNRANYTHDGLECQLQISVWYQPGVGGFKGRGDKQIQLIQKRVEDLLTKTNLSINGWNTLQLRRSLIDIITDPDSVTRHGIQQFKLFLGGNL